MSSEDDWNPDDVGDEESHGGRGSMESWNPDDDGEVAATATNGGVHGASSFVDGSMTSQWLDLESTLGRVAQIESTLPEVEGAATTTPVHAPAREPALEMAPIAPAIEKRAETRGSPPLISTAAIYSNSTQVTNVTANPLTASSSGPEARENSREGVVESKDPDPSRSDRSRTASDPSLVTGTSQEVIESMVEEIGVGFYSLCTCLLLRHDVPLFKQLLWCGGSIMLMILQLVSLLGLIIEVMMPLCNDNEDCHYPGYFCASLTHVRGVDLYSRRTLSRTCNNGEATKYTGEIGRYKDTKPFCFECRLAVCAYDVFNGTENSRFGPTRENAAESCVAEVDPHGATMKTCFPMHQMQELGNVTAYFVILLVAVGLAVAIMSEKRQMLVQGRILNLALEIPGTAGPVWSYFLKGLKHAYRKYVRKDLGGDNGDTKRHAKMRSKRSIMRLAKKKSTTALSMADYIVFHEWMEAEVPGDPNSHAALRNKVRFVMILSLAELTFLRRQLILALVPMTVSSLIMFEGADPLSVLLNGLATVFLLELDDAIGEAAFTAEYRGRVVGRIEAAVSTIQNLGAHAKVDNLCCYIDGWVSTIIIANNTIMWPIYYKGQTCVAILFQQLVVAGIINVIAQLCQEILRREYFYFNIVVGKKNLPRTARSWANVLPKRAGVIFKELIIDFVSFSMVASLAFLVMYIMSLVHNKTLAWHLLFFDMTDCPEWQPKCSYFDVIKAHVTT